MLDSVDPTGSNKDFTTGLTTYLTPAGNFTVTSS